MKDAVSTGGEEEAIYVAHLPHHKLALTIRLFDSLVPSITSQKFDRAGQVKSA